MLFWVLSTVPWFVAAFLLGLLWVLIDGVSALLCLLFDLEIVLLYLFVAAFCFSIPFLIVITWLLLKLGALLDFVWSLIILFVWGISLFSGFMF